MQDNTNFNIMYSCVQGTDGLTHRILSHIIHILDSRCLYAIFSPMTAYENPEICIPHIFIMHFSIKCVVFDRSIHLIQFLFTHRAKIMFFLHFH
jgi:hypothetical protein